MANIKKLVPGQVVWEIQRRKAGNTTIKTDCLYEIRIVSVNVERGEVVASWNGNPAKTYYAKSIKGWHSEKPVRVSSAMSFVDRYVSAAKARKMAAEKKTRDGDAA